MTGLPLYRPLIDTELGSWRRAGRRPIMWWRDDDTRALSPGLERLIAMTRKHRLKVALAIIPDRDLASLGAAIAAEPQILPIQHGCDHVDRARHGGASTEFASDASASDVASAITAGWTRLSLLPLAAPIYAPPWNAVTANVVAALGSTPLRALSLYGDAPLASCSLPRLDSHIDIMRWRPARFRGEAAILMRLWRLLRARRMRGRWEAPIGLLTHHRNLDEDAWDFLEAFFTRSADPGSGFVWRSARDLLPLGPVSPT